MKKVFSIFLSFILLLSNVGLTMATHYCAGEAVESQIMLVAGDIGCGMEEEKKEDCENLPKGLELKTKSCCDSDFQVFQNDDDLNNSKSDINQVLSFTAIFIQPYFNLFSVAKKQFVTQQDYTPPLPERDFQVLFQIFLI